MKKVRKRCISWLLVLTMVFSLPGGEIMVPQKAHAAEATINVKTAKVDQGTLSYPNLEVENLTKNVHNLTVSVDSGYIDIQSAGVSIKDTSGTKVSGTGTIVNSGVGAGSGFTELNTAGTKYEAVSFSSPEKGFTSAEIQSYLRKMKFSTDVKNITFMASTLSAADLKLEVGTNQWSGEKNYINLFYLNGHYYGYVPASDCNAKQGWKVTWGESYLKAKSYKFLGMEGYLATLTSRVEDRFLLSSFPNSGSSSSSGTADLIAKKGWIGCTRYQGDIDADLAKDGDDFGAVLPGMQQKGTKDNGATITDKNFVWRWASGPEGEVTGTRRGSSAKGMEFGEQIYSLYLQNPTYGDGGFDTFDGYFSNWTSFESGDSNGEPNDCNGKISEGFEGFGYYGFQANGRWNDNAEIGQDGIMGFYVEFGGYPGDEEKAKEELEKDPDKIVIEVEVPVSGASPSPTATEKATASPTATAKASASPTATAKASASPSASAEASASPSASAEASASPSASAEASIEPTPTATPEITKPPYKTYLSLTGLPKVQLVNEKEGNVPGAKLELNLDMVGLDGITNVDPAFTENYALDPKKYLEDNARIRWMILNDDGEWETVQAGPYKQYPTITLSESDSKLGNMFNRQVIANIIVDQYADGKYAKDVNDGADFQYSGDLISATYLTTRKPKGKIDGNPKIVYDSLEAGSTLTADVSDITPQDAQEDLAYQWYSKDPESGEWTALEDGDATDSEYKIKDKDLGKQFMVAVTIDTDQYTTEDDVDANGISKHRSGRVTIPNPVTQVTAAPTATPDAKILSGTPKIVSDGDGSGDSAGDILEANTDDLVIKDGNGDVMKDSDGKPLKPDNNELDYQWYTKGSDGGLVPIPDATDSSYVLTPDDLGKEIVVAVTGRNGVEGTRNSNPYAIDEAKIPITGQPTISNLTKEEVKDENGNLVTSREVVHAGTLLEAGTTDIGPKGCTYDYQWYVSYDGGKSSQPLDGETGKYHVITSDELNHTDSTGNVVAPTYTIKVTGTGKYYGDAASEGKELSRNASDVQIEDSENAGKRYITVTPTQDNTIYGVKKIDPETGQAVIDTPPCTDKSGNVVLPSTKWKNEEGYYMANAGDVLKFEVDKDKEYAIVEIHQDKTEKYIIVSKDITDDTVKQSDYDDKGTPGDNTDDTMSLTVDPADETSKYAVLQKVDGKYEITKVVPDGKGGYKRITEGEEGYDTAKEWTNGGDDLVTFNNLPADGTYKIVAIDKDTDIEKLIGKEIDPNEVEGGSSEKDYEPKPVDNSVNISGDIPLAKPSATPNPKTTGNQATSSPTTGASGSSIVLTPEQQASVDRFYPEHCIDPSSGTVVHQITDVTRDIIASGETSWNQMSQIERDAINQRLKNEGSLYTYEQLLEMAKQYKIPHFKLHKVMKKKTKTKLLMLKCKGATTVVTSTNKKVGVVTKKGVIKAKKPGRAQLTIVVSKEGYTNRLVINLDVKKKFKNAKELKKFKSKVVKTPTLLIAKKRELKKKTKIRVKGLETNATLQYKSYNKKAIPLSKKGVYKPKKKGKALMRIIVHQNDKDYFLYLYVTSYKNKAKKKK